MLVDHGITDRPPSSGVRTVTPSRQRRVRGRLRRRRSRHPGRHPRLRQLGCRAAARARSTPSPRASTTRRWAWSASCVVLADRPGHGQLDRPAGAPQRAELVRRLRRARWRATRSRRRLASVAGAFFACSREVWDRLGGMDESYFMYHEDTDLSLRCHLAGLASSTARMPWRSHAYDFSRNADKMFLLERNRFLTVLGRLPHAPAAARAARDLLSSSRCTCHRAARRLGPREAARLGLAGAARRRGRAPAAPGPGAVRAPTPSTRSSCRRSPRPSSSSPAADVAAQRTGLRAYWWLARPAADRGVSAPTCQRPSPGCRRAPDQPQGLLARPAPHDARRASTAPLP